MSTNRIDLGNFDEIPPEPNRLQSLAVSVNPSGGVSPTRLMRKALEKVGWSRVMLLTNKKGSMILIRRGDDTECCYPVPKKSAITAPAFSRALQKRGVRLSAHYLMVWNEAQQLFVGTRDNSAAPARPAGPMPDIEDVV